MPQTKIGSGFVATGAVGPTSLSTGAPYWDTSGNVGIGTTSPGQLLTISGAAGYVNLTSTTGTNTTVYRANNTGGYAFFGRDNSTGSSFGVPYASVVWANGAYPMLFATNDVERMRIDSSGNVGIGTSSPSYKLDITGGFRQQGAYAYFSTFNAGPAGTSPSVNGGLVFSNNITNGQAEQNIWNANDPATFASTGILFTQYLSSTTRRDLMFLHNNGNVGIGTNSPSTKLNVIGDIHVGTSGNSARINNSGNDIVQFYASRNGSNPYFYYNTSNSYGTTSDARSKNSITDISTSDALDYVMKLKPSSFKMNGDDKYQAGFIAQNCLEASQNEAQKSAVANYETYNEQDEDSPYLGVSDRPILAHAIAAIQELTAKVTALEAKVGP